MCRENDKRAAPALLLTLCNVGLAVATLTAFASWEARNRPGQALSLPTRPQPRSTIPSAAGPTVYFVASQEVADQLDEFWTSNRLLSGPIAPYRVVVVSAAPQERTARQAIANANVRRAASGRPAIRILDLRGLNAQAALSPAPDPDDGD
jgi:hypothetical protein